MPAIICPQCARKFLVRDREVAWAERLGRRMFCSRGCSATSRNVSPLLRGLLAVGLWLEVAAAMVRSVSSARSNAARRRLAFDLSHADVIMAAKKNRGRCAVSNIRFSSEPPTRIYDRHPWAPSIDRIDRSIGYVRGNVRFVCTAVNIAMNTWGQEALLTMAKAIVGHVLGSKSKSRE